MEAIREVSFKTVDNFAEFDVSLHPSKYLVSCHFKY